MTAYPLASAAPRSLLRPEPAIAGLAIGVGLMAAVNPLVALAACAGAIALGIAVFRPQVVPSILVLSMFAGALSFGSATAQRVAAPLAVIATVSNYLRAPVRLRGGVLTLLMITGYALVALTSLLWTISLSQTAYALFAISISLSYAAAFATLIRTRQELMALLRVIAMCSVALGLWWVASYARGISRASNASGDPNFMALLQLLALPLVLVLASSARTALSRVALYAGIAVIAASVVSTLSRGGLLTMVVMLAVIMALPARALFGSRRRKITVCLATLAGLIVLLGAAGSQLTERFQSTVNEPAGRSDLDRAALHSIAQHPILGIGYGDFSAYSWELLRSTEGVNLLVVLRYRSGLHAHNAYLETMAELGIPGLLLFGGVLVATGRSLIGTARSRPAADDRFIQSVAVGLAVSLVAVIVFSLSLSTETDRDPWLVVGLSLALPGLMAAAAHRPVFKA